MNRFLLTIFLTVGVFRLIAQPTFPYNGVRPKNLEVYAFTHAKIIVNADQTIENGTLIIGNGRIIAVNETPPANAVIFDLKGQSIYPSFIDLDSEYGLQKASSPEWKPGPQMESNRKGAFGWNQAIRSDIQAATLWSPSPDDAKDYRNVGIGAVLTFAHDGIARGTSLLVALGAQSNTDVILTRAGTHFSFNKGSSRQDYPSSLMGSIALLRQTFYDAQWYAAGGNSAERNISLESWNHNLQLPLFFEAGDKWNVLRAADIASEFSKKFIIRTGGDEYQRTNEIKKSGATLLVPVNFPDAWNVSDPELSRYVSLQEMKHWELAPYNCRILEEAGISFAITSSGLSDRSVFLKNIRKAVQCGMSEKYALRALTSIPAQLIKADSLLGSLEKNKFANFIIADGNIFSENTKIIEHWVMGERFILQRSEEAKPIGNFVLKLPKKTYAIKSTEKESTAQIIQMIADKDGKQKIDTSNVSVKLERKNALISLSFNPSDSIYHGQLRLSGSISPDLKSWGGIGEDPNGNSVVWSCVFKDSIKVTAGSPTKTTKDSLPSFINFPFGAYGWQTPPKDETVLIKNGKIWTCDQDSVIDNGQILISNGKIVAIGKLVDASKYTNVVVIDATGKHITPGIIDEHSHIAVASVNEGSQACSAEVKESSVLWPEDIDIYRQLAGGVTAAQILHGSANPIGGQSAIVKLRWGASANDMLIQKASPFIKFALGENVKQSNWGDYNRIRFPQTRMGVEQVYFDHFIRAREYDNAWRTYLSSKNKKGVPPRRDLELDALAEILNHHRFITCHSYQQSEINMLMHVADSLHFTVNTFTHILEGYKVADKMKQHGCGASTFSDWWAYKREVRDAIPYNAAILWRMNITTAINSDDPEMARRLNQEAGKTVKYGGVSETEALKMVTINPAKLLHLDEFTGSLKAGKDADLVIWSDHPLSVYAIAEKTFVDGKCYFDRKRDIEMRKENDAERNRLIQKMLDASGKGAKTQTPNFKPKFHFECDTIDETSSGIWIKN